MLGQLKVYPLGFWCQPTLPSCEYNEEQPGYFCVFMYCRSISRGITLISTKFGQTLYVSEVWVEKEDEAKMCTIFVQMTWQMLKFEFEEEKEIAIQFLNVPKIGIIQVPCSSLVSPFALKFYFLERACNYLCTYSVLNDLTINLKSSYHICNFTEKNCYPKHHTVLTFVNEKFFNCNSS